MFLFKEIAKYFNSNTSKNTQLSLTLTNTPKMLTQTSRFVTSKILVSGITPEMPENSSKLPGKKDQPRGDTPRYALTDTRKNLHHKFCVEFPEINVSFSVFCKARP